MKKILLTTVAIATLSSTTFASDLIENQVYIRGGISGSSFKKSTTLDVKIKPKFTTGMEIGAGYYFMDNLRGEIVYDHPFISDMKGSAIVDPKLPAVPVVGQVYLKKKEIKHKPTIHAVFARLAVDVVDLGVGKIFLTGGIGWSQVKDSVTGTAKGVIGIAPIPAPAPAPGGPAPAPITTKEGTITATAKCKTKNNIAWMAGAGVSFEIFEGGALEFRAGAKGYGKSKGGKFKTAMGDQSFGGKNFIEYSGTVSLRVQL